MGIFRFFEIGLTDYGGMVRPSQEEVAPYEKGFIVIGSENLRIVAAFQSPSRVVPLALYFTGYTYRRSA